MPKHIQKAVYDITQKLKPAESLAASGLDYKKLQGEKIYTALEQALTELLPGTQAPQ